MLDYSKLYQPKKIGSKKVKLNTKKNKKLYGEFTELVILLCIVLSFVMLIYSIGNIIEIVNYNYNDGYIKSNVFLIISNAIFNNLSSILTILTVTVFCKEKKGILISFLSLLIFFAIQSSFIKGYGEQIKILYFFKITKLVLFKNLGINSLNIRPIGGFIFGLICSYVINQLYAQRMPKTLSFLNGLPLVTIILFLVIVLYTTLFLLIYIFIFYSVTNLKHIAVIYFNSSLYNFFYNLLALLLSPLGFSTFLNNIFYLNQLYSSKDFIFLFQKICIQDHFIYHSITNKWDNDQIDKVWKYLNLLKMPIEMSLNQWILFLPFINLPNNNEGHMTNLFDWFNQTSMGNNYSVIFGFFLAFGVVLMMSCKKDNKKPTILVVSLMLLTVLLTGKTYTLSLMLLFTSPLLYLGLYLPITLLNSLLINLIDIHLISVSGSGLIDYIAFGIIPAAKGTNFSWAFLFTFIWFIISSPLLYFIIIKKDLPFIGRTETIIPRLTHRQIHEFFNN